MRRARQTKKALPDIEITKWETHFRNVLNHSSSINDQMYDHDRTRPQANGASMSEYHMNEMCMSERERPISKEEERQSIKNLKQGKKPELDNVCDEYPKNGEANITPFFTLLFNKIYDSSCFPSDWCKSITIPLFKRGNKSDPDNYRGIYLLSVVSKVRVHCHIKQMIV